MINNHNSLRKNLKKILSIKKTVMCELIMDPNEEQIPKAINRRDKNGKSIPTTFEDMYPFLNKKDIEESTFEHYITKHKK